MIPAKIIRFLEGRANLGIAGTRDGNLVPSGHRVSGWQTDAAGRTLTAFVAPFSVNRLIESLLHNGAIAVTIEEAGTHETYQFKGRYLHHRGIQDGDIEVADRVRRRFVRSLRPMYPDAPEPVLNAFVSPPSLAVDFEVLEIYLQTPGPGAGTRLFPPVDR